VSSASATDPIRVVIDETSFDFRGLQAVAIEDRLDDFNATVRNLRLDGIAAWKPPMLDAFACVDGKELFDYLTDKSGSAIDRDTKEFFFSILDKCPEWETPALACLDVALPGGQVIMALSVAFALTCAIGGHGVACLVFGSCDRRRFVEVTGSGQSRTIFFFADRETLPQFWRSLYELEDIPEEGFFTYARQAFPALLLHPDLTFRRFEGSYRSLRPQVMTHLGILNDDFLAVHRAASGIAKTVESSLAGIGASPESPKTHQNEKAMRQRDVTYDDKTIRCEWHTKIEPHRNRIHFAFNADLGDSILIGIFVDHLDT
jgi:hypothetical protein